MIKLSTESLTEWARLAAEQERRLEAREVWIAERGPDDDATHAVVPSDRPVPDAPRSLVNTRSASGPSPFGGRAIYELRSRLREQGRPKAA